MAYNPLDHEENERKKTLKERKAQTARENEEEDIRKLMSQKWGRRFLSRIISISGIYRSSFTGNSETFFREGMRNVGLMLVDDAQKLCPDEFVTMLKEYGNGRNDSSSDRTT